MSLSNPPVGPPEVGQTPGEARSAARLRSALRRLRSGACSVEVCLQSCSFRLREESDREEKLVSPISSLASVIDKLSITIRGERVQLMDQSSCCWSEFYSDMKEKRRSALSFNRCSHKHIQRFQTQTAQRNDDEDVNNDDNVVMIIQENTFLISQAPEFEFKLECLLVRS